VKILSLLTFAALACSAQSNPTWWGYVPTDSTSLVGVDWRNLSTTMFAEAVSAEMEAGGAFAFPDVELLRMADQLIVASPQRMAVEFGTFPLADLRAQAAAAGLKRSSFSGKELWLANSDEASSIARINEKLLIVGPADLLRDAIARMHGTKSPQYSPLLERASRYAKEDLWVVAGRLPDPLASLFVPLKIEATAFEGSLSAWDGLHVVAAIERATPNRALDFADTLAEALASRPDVAESTEIATHDRSVLVRMNLDEDQLRATMRNDAVEEDYDAAEPKAHLVTVATTPAKPLARTFIMPTPSPIRATVLGPKPAPVETQLVIPPPVYVLLPGNVFANDVVPSKELPPAPPKVIRILGLTSGPREIPFH
jgi:hypothetical protein